jgi:hypothetical protein
MKKIILMMGLISFNALASAPNFDIQGFNFTYNDPTGTGTATSFSYDGAKADQDGLIVDVEKNVQDFNIQVKGAETRNFQFKNAPKFVVEAQTMELRNFNANSSARISLNLDYASFDSAKDSLELKNFFLSCDKSTSSGEAEFIQGCIQKMNMKSSSFSSSSESKDVMSAFKKSLLSATQSKSLSIKSIDLKTVNGKFDLAADIKAQISGSAKAYGNLSYDEATKILTIKISDVKFGILNVTTKVFDELKKQESATLKVNKPYVYYQLK